MSVIIIWVLFVYFYECYCLLMSVFVEYRHFTTFITVAAWQACLGAARVRADFACRALTPFTPLIRCKSSPNIADRGTRNTIAQGATGGL